MITFDNSILEILRNVCSLFYQLWIYFSTLFLQPIASLTTSHDVINIFSGEFIHFDALIDNTLLGILTNLGVDVDNVSLLFVAIVIIVPIVIIAHLITSAIGQ